MTTAKLDPILPLRLSYVDIGNLAGAKQDVKITKPVGTGPYSFVSRTPGQSIKLTRFDGYWGKSPAVKEVTYVYRVEPAVRAGMVTAGEAQMAIAIRREDATSDDRTVSYKDNRIFLARTNTYKEPFIDPRVRMAVSHAIDRDAITKALMGVTGSPWYQMLGPQVNGYIPDFDKDAFKFDPKKAKELIAAAKADGHPVETEFDIVTRPDILPGGDEVVQAIAQNLERRRLQVPHPQRRDERLAEVAASALPAGAARHAADDLARQHVGRRELQLSEIHHLQRGRFSHLQSGDR